MTLCRTFLSALLPGLVGLGLPDAHAAAGVSPVAFSRFIGPDDCPGSHEFADPHVLKHGDAWHLTSTYGVAAPMVMFKTTDWKTKTRLPLSIDLNPLSFNPDAPLPERLRPVPAP
jgi:hypothetical protein